MKKISLFFILILCYNISHAQTGNIAGKVVDSSEKKILPLATVTVFKAKDTTIVTYRLSGPDGEFKSGMRTRAISPSG